MPLYTATKTSVYLIENNLKVLADKMKELETLRDSISAESIALQEDDPTDNIDDLREVVDEMCEHLDYTVRITNRLSDAMKHELTCWVDSMRD